MSRRDEELFPSEAQGLALGLVSGAVLGAAAALLLSSKTGETLKDSLCEACNGITDSLSERFTQNSRKRSNDHLNMVIGGIAGSVLGISAIIFLSSKSARGLRRQVMHSIDVLSDKSHKMADQFSGKAQETYEHAGEQVSSWIEAAQEFLGKQSKNSHDHESLPEKAIYWTLLGIRLYQSLKKER